MLQEIQELQITSAKKIHYKQRILSMIVFMNIIYRILFGILNGVIMIMDILFGMVFLNI